MAVGCESVRLDSRARPDCCEFWVSYRESQTSCFLHVPMLVAMVIAVRQALDYHGTGRAIAVCLIGWLVHEVILTLLGI